MQYRNVYHEERYRKILESGKWEDRTLLAAMFLLTADGELWRRAQSRITDMVIRFHDVRLTGISERGYTLFCGAKDLYFGTKNLCITDLSDAAIVDSEAFDLIITAMAIKRYGTGVLRKGENKYDPDNHSEQRDRTDSSCRSAPEPDEHGGNARVHRNLAAGL